MRPDVLTEDFLNQTHQAQQAHQTYPTLQAHLTHQTHQAQQTHQTRQAGETHQTKHIKHIKGVIGMSYSGGYGREGGDDDLKDEGEEEEEEGDGHVRSSNDHNILLIDARPNMFEPMDASGEVSHNRARGRSRELVTLYEVPNTLYGVVDKARMILSAVCYGWSAIWSSARNHSR